MSDHRARVYDSIVDLLSNEENPTPLVRLHRVVPFQETQIFAKLEWYNPFGAVKDRIAANMIQQAEAQGCLQTGQTLVEPTSGNTGFALTMLANARGCSITSPLSTEIPLEKRVLLRFFGNEVVELQDTLCPAPGAPEGAIALAKATSEKPGHIMLNQYANPNNPEAHYRTTGPEVWRQTDGRVTHFVAGLGTCGTVMGTGRYLREQNPDVQIIGVHPENGHDIPGVRSLRQLQQTELFDERGVDRLVEVSNREAFDMCLRLNREESIIAGPSSAMALVGALKTLQDIPDARVVVIFPDNVFKYASSVQRHFSELFKNTVGSSASGPTKSNSDVLLDKMISLARNDQTTIELDDAYQLHQSSTALFVDVRNREQYGAMHVTGAVNVPMEGGLDGDQQLPSDYQYPPVPIDKRRG